MTHARKTYRDLIVGYLTGLATSGANVSAHRVYAHADLPSVNVTTLSEAIAEDLRTRTLEVVIEVRAKVADTLADTLDQMAAEVELALETNYLLDGSGAQLVYDAMSTDIDNSADQPIGLMTLRYLLHYQYVATA